MTLAKIKTFVLKNIGNISDSDMTVSTSDPTGGKDKDIWYKVDSTKILSISVNDDGTWKSVDLSTL